MEFGKLLKIVGEEPVFESALLLSGSVNPSYIRLQLDRWIKSGRLYQLRRGLYALAPPFQKVKPHPFLIANRLHRASYVSLQAALAFHGLIPDSVQIITSVTGGRPDRVKTPLGIFEYRHIKPAFLVGYSMVDQGGQKALVATAEKALLDLIYLNPGSQREEYLTELRLQNLDRLNPAALQKLSALFGSPKVEKAVKFILWLIETDVASYEDL
jgi:predicted transcriptional regulator of viral defense system